MAKRNAAPPTDSRASVARLIVALMTLALVTALIYRYYKNNLEDYSLIPQELQINYRPADFRINIDEEEALKILSNPQRYRKEFSKLVYDINIAILDHVSDRMGLGADVRGKVRSEYDKHHPYLKNLYYHDFVAMKDTTSNLYQTWYDNEFSNAVEILHEIASKYTCFMVNHVITSLIETSNGSVYARGKSVNTPCGVAMTEALKPLIKRMEERAAIEDFSRSRGLMQEKIEKAIAELATMEVRDKKGLSRQMQTKIWGFSVSSTDVEISAISILKVGFRLNEYLDIRLDPQSGIVTVTLPQPTVLSHEVYPKIDKLDIGWLREVKSVDLNRSFNVLRAEFRRDALESGEVNKKAQEQVTDLMQTMFGPVVASINKRYKVRVRFKDAPRSLEDDAPEFTNATATSRTWSD
ncbi:MAG TPA: DUF4230 domain-containing protein [Saprospiraceae bacterium]|nr:DUF4230 domain-containing protein [Saprospiraceae bacterium]HMP12949.1 DUF4230 domain-containing protein [Saprospiraceae bacterium]